MARTKYITRTVLTTDITIKVVNNVTEEVTDLTVTVQGVTVKSDASAFRLAKAMLDKATYTPIKLVSYVSRETIYGLPEQVFVDMGVIIDPTTRRPKVYTEEEYKEMISRIESLFDDDNYIITNVAANVVPSNVSDTDSTEQVEE